MCSKGYALKQYSLDNERLKYPLRQMGRDSGVWRRVSWDEAFEVVSTTILDLYGEYKNFLSCGLYLGYGNSGLTHRAARGMFCGLGPVT